jgi:hypothetical protein
MGRPGSASEAARSSSPSSRATRPGTRSLLSTLHGRWRSSPAGRSTCRSPAGAATRRTSPAAVC